MGFFGSSSASSTTTTQTDNSSKAAQDDAVVAGGDVIASFANKISTGDNSKVVVSDRQSIDGALALSRFAVEQNTDLADKVLDAFGTVSSSQSTMAEKAMGAAVAQADAEAGQLLPTKLLLAVAGAVALVAFWRK